MDSVFYDFIEPNTKVCFIRSSVEHPFTWTIFEGIIAHAYSFDNRFFYHCTLTNICATEEWIRKYVANCTYRLTSIETGKQANINLYYNPTQEKTFIDAWKLWWHSKWLFDLTPDLVFVDDTKQSALCKSIKAVSTILQNNITTFKEIEVTMFQYIETLLK